MLSLHFISIAQRILYGISTRNASSGQEISQGRQYQQALKYPTGIPQDRQRLLSSLAAASSRTPLVSLKESSNLAGTNFWGYYDKSPVNGENTIYNLVPSGKKIDVHNSDEIELYWNDKKISTTNTWNWQQGSMLTWLNKNEIIHNLYIDGEYKSKPTDYTCFNSGILFASLTHHGMFD